MSKIIKGTRYGNKSGRRGGQAFVTLTSNTILLNAACRDFMGDPDFVSVEVTDERKMVISPSKNEGDYRVTKDRGQRKFSALAVRSILGLSWQDNIRMYVILRNGKVSTIEQIPNFPDKGGNHEDHR